MESSDSCFLLPIVESGEVPRLDLSEKRSKKLKPRNPKALKMKSMSLPVCTKSTSSFKGISYDICDFYNLLEKVGFGTYSQVKRAINKATGQEVAVKICKGTTACRMLKAEADILEQLSSKYVPKFYEFKQDPVSNRSFLVMEYVRGNALDKFIETNGTLDEKTATGLIAKLVNSIQELHSKGIAHRDIKPQNIIITEDMELKLIDFNISKTMESKSAHCKNKKPLFESKFK